MPLCATSITYNPADSIVSISSYVGMDECGLCVWTAVRVSVCVLFVCSSRVRVGTRESVYWRGNVERACCVACVLFAGVSLCPCRYTLPGARELVW